MAYYAKVDKFGNYCGKTHTGDSLDVFQMWNDCDYRGDVSDFLCELESREDVNKDSARASTSINIGISHGKSPPVPHVKCPDGHVTHAFLACDMQSACWQDRQESVESEVWGVPSTASCPAPMTSLPAMFTCSSGGQRVSYSMVCDHRPQCGDGSDESFCVFPPCSATTPMQCGTSTQVHKSELEGGRGGGGGGGEEKEKGMLILGSVRVYMLVLGSVRLHNYACVGICACGRGIYLSWDRCVCI